MTHATSGDSLATIRAAFDPQAFRERGHALIDSLADYLQHALAGRGPVLPWRAPADMVAAWPLPLGGADPLALLDRLVTDSNHLHHPRYVGHQVTSPLPIAALSDLVSSLLNNGAAVYEMGAVGVAAERRLVRFLADTAGLPASTDGIFTSGGSAGNLTALLCARQAKAGFDVWTGGAHAGPPLSFLVSEQTHYSVARALAIMGLGTQGAWPVPVDENFRLRPGALAAAKQAAENAGRRVIGVVASAGSTATGAFDPLDAVADFCSAHDLWFHVDGAHGASAALSPTHRPRLKGVERADSLVWDAHKMMLVPALVTAVLIRDGRHSYAAFAQQASYLFSGAAPDEQWENLGQRTLECTKSLLALKLFIAVAHHGPKFFADYIDGMFALAQRFADRVAAAPDFTLPTRPDCNIVCFRYDPASDEAHTRIRQRLIESGRFYLVQTKLHGVIHLRVTLINPFTTDDDLAALLDAVRETHAAL